MFKTPKRILLRASLTASAFLLGACTSQAGAAEVESAYVAIVESVPEAEQPYAEELANASDPEPEYHAAGFITMGARTMRMHVNWDNPRSWGFRPSLGRQTGQYSDGWGERSFHPIFRDFYSRVEARRRSEWGDSSVNFASIILQEWPSMLPGAISFFNADGVFDYAGQPMYYTDYLDGNPANPIRAVDFSTHRTSYAYRAPGQRIHLQVYSPQPIELTRVIAVKSDQNQGDAFDVLKVFVSAQAGSGTRSYGGTPHNYAWYIANRDSSFASIDNSPSGLFDISSILIIDANSGLELSQTEVWGWEDFNFFRTGPMLDEFEEFIELARQYLSQR